NEGNAHEQQPQPRIARAGFDSGLVHLTITRLDAKALAIDFADLLGSAMYLPDRVQEFLSTPLAAFFVRVVLAGDTNLDPRAGLLFLLGFRRGERFLIVTVLFLQQCAQPVQRGFGILGLPAPHDRGNDETVA